MMKEYLEIAAKELKELASTHGIELDSWIQEVIEDWFTEGRKGLIGKEKINLR